MKPDLTWQHDTLVATRLVPVGSYLGWRKGVLFEQATRDSWLHHHK